MVLYVSHNYASLFRESSFLLLDYFPRNRHLMIIVIISLSRKIHALQEMNRLGSVAAIIYATFIHTHQRTAAATSPRAATHSRGLLTTVTNVSCRRHTRGSDSLMVTCMRPSSAEPTFSSHHCVPSETLALRSADDIFGMLKRLVHRV